jgi:hypothetical protein
LAGLEYVDVNKYFADKNQENPVKEDQKEYAVLKKIPWENVMAAWEIHRDANGKDVLGSTRPRALIESSCKR